MLAFPLPLFLFTLKPNVSLWNAHQSYKTIKESFITSADAPKIEKYLLDIKRWLHTEILIGIRIHQLSTLFREKEKKM